MEDDNININKRTAILGVKCKSKKLDKLQCLSINGKIAYIYMEQINQHEPSLYKFLCMLKYKIKIEKIMSLKNNNMSKFDTLWGEIKEKTE